MICYCPIFHVILHQYHDISYSIFHEISYQDHSILYVFRYSRGTVISQSCIFYKILCLDCYISKSVFFSHLECQNPEGHSKCYQGNHEEANTFFPSHSVCLSCQFVFLVLTRICKSLIYGLLAFYLSSSSIDNKNLSSCLISHDMHCYEILLNDLNPHSHCPSLGLQVSIEINYGIFPIVVSTQLLLNSLLVRILHIKEAAEELELSHSVTNHKVDFAVVTREGVLHIGNMLTPWAEVIQSDFSSVYGAASDNEQILIIQEDFELKRT